jgi:hypothetical protein
MFDTGKGVFALLPFFPAFIDLAGIDTHPSHKPPHRPAIRKQKMMEDI